MYCGLLFHDTPRNANIHMFYERECLIKHLPYPNPHVALIYDSPTLPTSNELSHPFGQCELVAIWQIKSWFFFRGSSTYPLQLASRLHKVLHTSQLTWHLHRWWKPFDMQHALLLFSFVYVMEWVPTNSKTNENILYLLL